MLIREAAGVFWQTLKDTWEELVPLVIVNVVWLLTLAIPLGLSSLVIGTALAPVLVVVGIILFALVTPGGYAVTNRVAHATTFHFSDFVDGAKRFWRQAILWALASAGGIFVILWYVLLFLPQFEGIWVGIVAGLLLGVLVIWLAMQVYFWPLMIAQEEPKILMAWRNALFLILANPFYAFFISSFALLLFIGSVALVPILVLVGLVVQGLLGNNAVLTLLAHFEKIDAPRPPGL